MPRVDLDLNVEIEDTPRAVQLRGIFDVQEATHASVTRLRILAQVRDNCGSTS